MNQLVCATHFQWYFIVRDHSVQSMQISLVMHEIGLINSDVRTRLRKHVCKSTHRYSYMGV